MRPKLTYANVVATLALVRWNFAGLCRTYQGFRGVPKRAETA
jgi:hypothetical protein